MKFLNMKQLCTLLSFFLWMVIPLVGQNGPQDFAASLSGNQQPFPVLSLASGTVNATLVGDTLAVSGQIQNVTSGIDTSISGGIHIHNGLAGRNGGVELVLQPVLSEGLDGAMFDVASNTFILDQDQLDAIQCRGLYINVHSIDHPGGEVRGQLLPAADEVYNANLFGSNAVPSVMTEATGALMFELTGNELVVSGSVNNLSSPLAVGIAGGIHIHAGAAGENGGVEQALVATLSDDSLSFEIRGEDNIYQLTDEQVAALRSEKLYINVHTARFNSGELRGQITPLAVAKFRTHLSGANEAPPVVSFAHGKLVYGLRDGSLTVSGSFAGLESDLATNIAGGMHIHLGMAGRNGSLAFPLTVDVGDDNRSGYLDPANNVFSVSGDTLLALMGRALYVNVHSADNGGGEIRGQILPEAQYFLNATLAGSQIVSPVQSDGAGACVVEVLGSNLTVSGTFQNLAGPLLVNVDNGAHIHFAPVGSNGPHLINLLATPDDDIASGRFRAVDNQFVVSESRKDSLKARIGYISVHSEAVMPGEIRGQLMHEACAYFFAPLSGAAQTPAVNTEAEGAAMLEYNGSSAIVVGSFSGLSSPVNTNIAGGTHLHGALAGSNGPVLIPLGLTQSDDLTAGVWQVQDNIYAVSPERMDTVRKRMTYVNIHTEDNGGGELRGNFRPLAQNYYLANLRGKNAASPAPSTGMGAMIFEQTGSTVVASGSFNGLMSDFATNIAGGAHVHIGMAGMNGSLAVRLNSIVGDDLRSAAFPADSNQISLVDTLELLFENGNTYVNVHSADVPGGEIRGQILHEINHAPAAVAITAPSSSDTIVVEGDPATPFAATWDPSDDPDGNKVVYLWQLAADRDFNVSLVNVNTGTSTEFQTTFGLVDSLLALAGVDSGQVITLYHRVVAADGSLCSADAVDSVVIQKGQITSIEENPYLDAVFGLYPNPTIENLSVDFDMKQTAAGEFTIHDLGGKLVYRQSLILPHGKNLIQIDVEHLRSGNYVANLIVDQKIAVAKTFIKL